mmetsp:Transcript_33942/g.43378  ORF Transcript_33942/g.43378 Transcript_33942/m.43378 type:complete len:254 (+) Transcript_33942:67-828(+)
MLWRGQEEANAKPHRILLAEPQRKQERGKGEARKGEKGEGARGTSRRRTLSGAIRPLMRSPAHEVQAAENPKSGPAKFRQLLQMKTITQERKAKFCLMKIDLKNLVGGKKLMVQWSLVEFYHTTKGKRTTTAQCVQFAKMVELCCCVMVLACAAFIFNAWALTKSQMMRMTKNGSVLTAKLRNIYVYCVGSLALMKKKFSSAPPPNVADFITLTAWKKMQGPDLQKGQKTREKIPHSHIEEASNVQYIFVGLV